MVSTLQEDLSWFMIMHVAIMVSTHYQGVFSSPNPCYCSFSVYVWWKMFGDICSGGQMEGVGLDT